MALTAQQKLDCLKHLGLNPNEVVLDQTLAVIAQTALQETELTALITALNTALAAIKTAEDATDEIRSGEGASINYRQQVVAREKTYRRQLEDLVRIVQHPCLTRYGGGGNATYGWECGT